MCIGIGLGYLYCCSFIFQYEYFRAKVTYNYTARLLHMTWRHTNIYTTNSRLEDYDKFTKLPYIVIQCKCLVPLLGAICFRNRLATSEAECIPRSHAVIVHENRSAPRSVARAVTVEYIYT